MTPTWNTEVAEDNETKRSGSRHNVVSVRITDEQMARLKNLGGRRKMSVSELIREALSFLDLASIHLQ